MSISPVKTLVIEIRSQKCKNGLLLESQISWRQQPQSNPRSWPYLKPMLDIQPHRDSSLASPRFEKLFPPIDRSSRHPHYVNKRYSCCPLSLDHPITSDPTSQDLLRLLLIKSAPRSRLTPVVLKLIWINTTRPRLFPRTAQIGPAAISSRLARLSHFTTCAAVAQKLKFMNHRLRQ